MLEKVRGTKRFSSGPFDLIGEPPADFSNTVFGISHTGNIKDAEYLRSGIESRYHRQLYGRGDGTYAGKGGSIISFV